MQKVETMRKVQHKDFMTGNKLDSNAFSKPVQKKVQIFDKMFAGLEDTVAEDRKELLHQLKELDHEIHEDMLEEMEDQLENNDVLEPAHPSDEEKEKKPEPKKEEKPEKKAEPNPKNSDETILDELWKIGRTKGLSRSFLKENGIRRNITGWTILIGKYALHRTAVFSYKYNLEKLKS